MTDISLTIDGRSVTVESGKTVLEAARGAGIHIPTICAHEDLPHYGACRMCVVEIEKVRGFPTSCTTPATDGMVVNTQSDELESLRNRVLELMLSGHPNACLVCDHRTMCEELRPKPTKAGKTTRCAFCSGRESCTLREMALEAKTSELSLPTLYSLHKVERDDPFMDRDYNLCILCGRCWRICQKIHGKPAISINHRGKWAKLGTSFDKSHVHSGCTFCGACIDICPTGTLSDRYARWYGVPDEEVLSTCLLCGQGCQFWVRVEEHRMVGTRMPGFNKDARLCAIGRFAYAQVNNAPDRLRRPAVMEDGEQISTDWDHAISSVAKSLENHKGDSFAIIANEAETRETRYVYERFAKEVMKGRIGYVPAAGGFDDIKPEALKKDILAGKIKAAIITGDFLDVETAPKIGYKVVVDCLPSVAAKSADALLPAAVLSEVEGTYRNHQGEIKAVSQTTPAPGQARPEWMIVRDLARALEAKGFHYESVSEVTPEIEHDPAPNSPPGSPRDNLDDLPDRYRGHYIADTVCALEAIGLAGTPVEPLGEDADEGFPVVEKREIIPNFHHIKIQAPQVAKHARPGQFAILMAKETSERVPFTLVDWDADEGTITLVVEEVGRSSREVTELSRGDRVSHVTGPLGLPHPIEKVGTVVLGGGCYGIGAIYPIARALKEAGNTVILVAEAASHYLLYMEDELRSACDELLFATKDGSRGTKGGVQEVFVNLVETGTKVDMFVAIGCTFMMKMASEATQPFGIPTYVALNPIMVDGTGMCGACRVSIAGETKFACVDGPMFNGHDVDWDELFSRRGAYAMVEIEALPQGANTDAEREQLTHKGECAT